VPSVNSAYAAESTDGTLPKSATKKQSSFSTQSKPIWGAGADGEACALFHDTPDGHFGTSKPDCW